VAGHVERLRKSFAADKTLSKAWRVHQLEQLIKLLDENRKEIYDAFMKDLHKSAYEADITEIDLTKSEAIHAIEHLDDWMAPHRESISALNQPGSGCTVADPLGVVCIMSAWNYPVLLLLSPLVGALAAGNCVMLKPASYSPNMSNVMARLVTKYLDNDCVAVCEGNRDVTDAMLKVRFDKIFFTGSGFVGKLVAKAAAEHITPCVLELGGKSPCLVDKTADLDLASSRLVWGAFMNSGQTCIRPDHVLVDESVGDAFVTLCKEKIARFYSNDVQKTEWFGRIINESAHARLAQIIEQCKANVVHGGKVDAKDKFIEPTLINYRTDLASFHKSAAMQDELFGPVLPIAYTPAGDIERMIEHARNLPTGKPLALYFFSSNQANIDAVIKRTTSGGMCINDTLMHIANHDLPFGGVGASGMGAYHGRRSFACFSHEKAVLIKYSGIDGLPVVKDVLAVRFPPYSATSKALVGVLSHPALDWVNGQVERPAVQRVLLLLVAWLVGRRFVQVSFL